MTSRIYKTAQGKVIDFGAMVLKNENMRAVGIGTQPVNARGDLINSNNEPIDTRNQQLARQYNKQISNTNSDPVRTSNKNAPAPMAAVDIPVPPEDFEDDFEKTDSAPASLPAQGLASAIAKARQVKQTPMTTPRQTAQATAGVKKI